MKYIITTLGCKVNQYESQAAELILGSHGHQHAAPGEPADAVIINTCAVTAESERKSRQTIRRLRDENPGAVIAVSGCYSQLSPDKVSALGTDILFGTNDKAGFIAAVEKAVEDRQQVKNVDDPFKRREFEALPAGALSGRTRAMLKIQDGCVNFCTYCIIPYTRGRLRSLPPETAAAETRKLREEGYKEIVLTGIEVASYGRDLPEKPGLADVINACAAEAGDMRIRLGSLEPTVITEEFCAALADNEKMCRHFHLSLQSGCDRTLRAMNRKYKTDEFYAACQLLRQYFPGCALTCDLITGFPGETEEDHAETLEFIKKCAFAAMHIFPYSRRPGTPADSMPNQIQKAVKAARAAEAQKIAEEMHSAFLAGSIGQELQVLFETEADGFCIGHSDTYILVKVPGTGLRTSVKNVKITGSEDENLVGLVL